MSMIKVPALPTYEELVQSNMRDIKSFVTRIERIQEYGFPIIHDKTIEILRKFLRNKKVVEIGSGNGYLAYYLEQAGVDITAVNNYCSGDYNSLNWKDFYYKRDRQEDARYHYYYYNKYNCIIMSWPDSGDDLAYLVAKRMKKDRILIYQGESKYGCTANDNFFNYIEKYFRQIKPIQRLLNDKHLQYFGIHDYWYILKKN
jgi:hypothetical protein